MKFFRRKSRPSSHGDAMSIADASMYTTNTTTSSQSATGKSRKTGDLSKSKSTNLSEENNHAHDRDDHGHDHDDGHDDESTTISHEIRKRQAANSDTNGSSRQANYENGPLPSPSPTTTTTTTPKSLLFLRNHNNNNRSQQKERTTTTTTTPRAASEEDQSHSDSEDDFSYSEIGFGTTLKVGGLGAQVPSVTTTTTNTATTNTPQWRPSTITTTSTKEPPSPTTTSTPPPPSTTKKLNGGLLCFTKKITSEPTMTTPELTPLHSANSSASSSTSSSSSTCHGTTTTTNSSAPSTTLSAKSLEDKLSLQEEEEDDDDEDQEEPPSLRSKPKTKKSPLSATTTTVGGRLSLQQQQDKSAARHATNICMANDNHDDHDHDDASFSRRRQDEAEDHGASWSGDVMSAATPHYSPATDSVFSTPRAGCGANATAAPGRNICSRLFEGSTEYIPPLLPTFENQNEDRAYPRKSIATNSTMTTIANGRNATTMSPPSSSPVLQNSQLSSSGEGIQLAFAPQPSSFAPINNNNNNNNNNHGIKMDQFSPLLSGEIIIQGKKAKKSASADASIATTTTTTVNDDISTLGFEVASSIMNFNMTDSELMDKRHGSPGQLRLTEAGLEEHTKMQTEEIMIQSKEQPPPQHRSRRNNNNHIHYCSQHTMDMKGYHAWKQKQDEKKFYRDKHEQRDLKLEAKIMEQQHHQAELYGSEDAMAATSDLVVPLGLEPPPKTKAKATTTTTMEKSLNPRPAIAIVGAPIIQLLLPNRGVAPSIKEKGVELMSLEPMNNFDPSVFEYTPAPGRPSPFGLRRIRKKKTSTTTTTKTTLLSPHEVLLQQERTKQRNAEIEKERLEQEEFNRIQKRREEYLKQQRALETMAQEEKKKGGENKDMVRKVVVVQQQPPSSLPLHGRRRLFMKNTKQHSMRVLVPPSESQAPSLATVNESHEIMENDDDDDDASYRYHHYKKDPDNDRMKSRRRKSHVPHETKISSTPATATTTTSSCADESTFTLDTKASTEPCVVCMEGERTHIAMPCMHYSFCEDCVSTMECRGIKTCPCCKAKNTSFTKVFF